MDDSLSRRAAARPRRLSAASAATSPQDGEVVEVHPPMERHCGPDRAGAAAGDGAAGAAGGAAGITERRNSASLVVHHRHMPKEPKMFHIPRKTKEKMAPIQYISTESREYEDMMNILTSSYFDPGSAGTFSYSKPRLIHSELLEKEFVEKRREMKADGRTDKELEESYCFLLTEPSKLPKLSENGICVDHSWITVLGNPSKGVYLSKYSDLLQMNPFTPGASGEIVILKVMKGKVKSIYENVKNLLDPTPRFDSHIYKNASNVTSRTSYRAFEFTQQYFYEYSFDELRHRPRQVCPYAVASFQFKGKDTILARVNSQPAEGSTERAQFTVWSGDLVKGDHVLCQVSLRSFSPPFLPHKLPEKLEVACAMRLEQLTDLLPSTLLSFNRYSSNQEVVENGHCCRLLEIIDRGRSTSDITRLLHEMETKKVVLVTPLSERGFLFLLSSVQMATPAERGENWKKCLQALFVFPETRDVSKFTPRRVSPTHDASESLISGAKVMPRLSVFIPALHHALVKARANPSPDLSAGVEAQAKEYLIGLKDGKVRQYPMGQYDSKPDEQQKVFPTPKHHLVNLNSYLRSYLTSPALYLLSVARAKQVVETHCGPEEPPQTGPKRNCGVQRELSREEVTSTTKAEETSTEKMQKMIDLVWTCKRNAENEVKREDGREGALKATGKKRKLEQQTAARAIKFLKAAAGHKKIPVEGSQSASPYALPSVIGSLGLRDADLREDGSEQAGKLLSLLSGLSRDARGIGSKEEDQKESSPFDRLATKLGLPTSCDIDLRKQEELEEQTAGSVSSLEGFSPGSHSGETNQHRAAGGGGQMGAPGYEDDEEEWEIPWVLIPITGLSSRRYSQKERLIPQDPRFRHLRADTNITMATKLPRKSPALSPGPSPSASSFTEQRPPLSPPHFPSPEPSPPLSPSQCPSPEPSPPISPSQCPSPEPSPPSSPSLCPSPQPSPPTISLPTRSPSTSRIPPPEPVARDPVNLGSADNGEKLPPTSSKKLAGMAKSIQEKSQEKEKKKERPSIPASIQPSVPQAAQRWKSHSPPASAQEKQFEQEKKVAVKKIESVPEEEKRENNAAEKVQMVKAFICSKDEKNVVELLPEVANEKEKMIEVKELVPPSISSWPTHSRRDIDSIVDKHMGSFFSEMHLLLQEEKVHCSFPQTLHSEASNAQTLSHSLTSQFSHFVSLHHSCPPVQDYVGSLQDSMNSMITEFDENYRSNNVDTTQTETDTVLASSVSAFVASIRAANQGRGDESPAPCGEVTTSDDKTPPTRTVALVKGEVWNPETLGGQISDSNSRSSPTLTNIIVSVANSVSDSDDPADLHAPSSTTAAHNNRQIQEVDRTSHGCSLTESNTEVPGSSLISETSAESSEPITASPSDSNLTPPPTTLSSLINQLKPEVFSSLLEIIKDVKRNSLQFYLHSTEQKDRVLKSVQEHLLKQGNVEQSPVTFLNQEKTDSRLLVVIKNKDIAGHIHKIPNLVSLKRRASVLFVGIDTLDDIKNNSYNELFVSGGCIISDDLILNPDVITYGQLAELLKLLEQHSSLESVWKWKIHCKTLKKLKEQTRFRRDAAKRLDLLSAYQKQQIVEFLPYHHCDMTNNRSPDLNCILELQARYTQYRHTIFLTEQYLEKSPDYISSGIVVAGVEDFLHNFNRLVGYHNIKEKKPVMDAVLASKGLDSQLSHGDSMLGCERSPSIFPEHVHPLTPTEQHQQPAASSFLPQPHLTDQLVPDTSCRDAMPQPTDTDFEVLRLAISHLRAERQAQLQQQQQLHSQLELKLNSTQSFISSPVCGVSSRTTTPPGQGGPAESTKVTPGRKAVAATLDFIHSALQVELVEEERRQGTVEPPTEPRKRGRQGGASDGPALKKALMEEKQAPGHSDTSTSSSNQTTELSEQGELTSTESKSTIHEGKPAFPQTTAAACSTSYSSVDARTSRDVRSDRGGAQPGSGSKVTGSVTMPKGQEDKAFPAPSQLQQVLQPQQQRHPHHMLQQQWGSGYMPPHLLPHYASQSFSVSRMLSPLTVMNRTASLLGPASSVWPGELGPSAAANLVWGFPHAVRNPGLLGLYRNPTGQGSSVYRGGHRGGFNGM